METTSTQPVGGNSAGQSEMLDRWMVPAVINASSCICCYFKQATWTICSFSTFDAFCKRLPHICIGFFQTSLYLDSIMPCGRYWQEPDWMHFNTLCPIPAGRHAGFVCNVFEVMSGVNNIP